MNKYIEVSKENIEYLIEQVYKYYPVGLQGYNIKDYVGIKLINEIVQSKLSNKIVDENSAINLLKRKIINTYEATSLIDLIHYEFPSYTIGIKLKNKDEDDFNLSTGIFIVISELVNFFTIYFEDFYNFKNNKGGFDCSFKVQSFVKKIETTNYQDYINCIINYMGICFPEKNYIYFNAIQHKIISSTSPYLVEIDFLQNHCGTFSLYDLLFSNTNVDFSGSIKQLH